MRSGDGSIVVIGVGNLQRGDDAVGRLAAQALATKLPPEIHIIEMEGAATPLLDALMGARGAIIIDACISGAPAGTIHRFDAGQAPLPATIGSVSSHGFGLTAALELARALGQLPKVCIVFAMEAAHFDYGGRLSQPIVVRFDDLLMGVAHEIASLRQRLNS